MYTADGKLNKSDLVEQYYPLVRRIAFNLKVKLPASVEVDDLIRPGWKDYCCVSIDLTPTQTWRFLRLHISVSEVQ